MDNSWHNGRHAEDTYEMNSDSKAPHEILGYLIFTTIPGRGDYNTHLQINTSMDQKSNMK